MPVSNTFRVSFLRPGNTVIDKIVEKMVTENVAYSFDLSEPEWRFLGENHAARVTAGVKPEGTVEINDRIGSWGGRTTTATSGAGYRAFEGGPAPGNVTLLQGAGGAFRCFWDSDGEQMWHIAGSTGSDDIKQGVVKYNAATDEFRHWTAGGEYTDTVLTVSSVISSDEFEATGAPVMPAGFYNGFGIDWPTIKDVRSGFTRRVTSYTPTADGRLRFTVENQPGDTTVRPDTFVGDVPKLRDSPASIFPWRGSAHNFGTSAWDPQRRRLYKLLRLPVQQSTFWMHRVDVGGEQEYATRADWLNGRDSWFIQAPAGGAPVGSYALWPQTVFVPDIGAEGSVVVLQKDSNTLDRWDCQTGVTTRYNLTFNASNTPISAQSPTTPDGKRGVTMVYHNGGLYVASLNGAVTGNPEADAELAWEFWRIPINGPGENDAGPIQQLAQCPVAMDLSGYGWPGTHTELCVLNGKIYAFHADSMMTATPHTVNFSGQVYRFDPDVNSGVGGWTSIAPSWAQKLVAMNRLQPPPDGTASYNFTVTEIPRLNAFLMASSVTSFSFQAWLFKPPL